MATNLLERGTNLEQLHIPGEKLKDKHHIKSTPPHHHKLHNWAWIILVLTRCLYVTHESKECLPISQHEYFSRDHRFSCQHDLQIFSCTEFLC